MEMNFRYGTQNCSTDAGGLIQTTPVVIDMWGKTYHVVNSVINKMSDNADMLDANEYMGKEHGAIVDQLHILMAPSTPCMPYM